MSRRFLAAAVLLSGVLGLMTSPAADQRPAEKTVLRFAPAVGTRLGYNFEGLVTVGGKDLLGRDLSLTAVSRGELHFGVQASTRDTVRARLTSPGLEIRVQVPDRTLTETLKTRDGQALEVVFGPTGRVEEIRNPDALSRGKILNFSLSQILTDYFPVLPAEAVSPGDGWSESRRMTIPFQEFELLVDLKAHYVLNEIALLAEGRKALISAVFSVSVSGRQGLGDSVGIFEGGGTGTGLLHFLLERGVFSEYRVDFKTDAAFVVKRGEERLLEQPFVLSVLAHITQTNPDRSTATARF